MKDILSLTGDAYDAYRQIHFYSELEISDHLYDISKQQLLDLIWSQHINFVPDIYRNWTIITGTLNALNIHINMISSNYFKNQLFKKKHSFNNILNEHLTKTRN